jgi:hypothetical protein
MVCGQAGRLLAGVKERNVDMVILRSEPEYQGAENRLFIALLFGLGMKTLWTVQPRIGRSHYTCEFERILFAVSRKSIESTNISLSKRARKRGKLRRSAGPTCKTVFLG